LPEWVVLIGHSSEISLLAALALESDVVVDDGARCDGQPLGMFGVERD
jgi:hypothetical protein